MSKAPPSALPLGPRLLVEWSSPGREFLTALGPALSRSPKKLAGEAPIGMFPLSGMLASWILECLLLAASITLPGRLAKLQPYTPLPRPGEDVIYFSGEELPQTEDAGGTDAGKPGRAGGHEDYHRTQTIKVARGTSLTEKVVDVPKFNLPKSDLPVANLLAVNKVPGPPPLSGLATSLPSFPQPAAVAPPPDVARERNQSVPAISSSVVVPPPEISREKLQGGFVIASSVIAPPPHVADNSRTHELTFTSGVVGPSPSLEETVSGVRAPMAHAIDVVPPPVSSPAGVRSVESRLMLPQVGVVAPPPSGITREISPRYPEQTSGIAKEVVPPPAELGQAMERAFSGTPLSPAKVVAPPPGQIGGAIRGRGTAGELATVITTVVPPPPVVSGSSSGSRRGQGHMGAGLGGDLDAGSVLGPPKAGGSDGKNVGVVTSNQPGPRLAVPRGGGAGAIAMSPTGNANRGIGGADAGNGIGRGTGPGSGLGGEARGAGKLGGGRGSDPTSDGGISPYPGPGGAGKATAGPSPAPGISVSGGTTVTLPSFAGDVEGSNSVPRSRVNRRRRGLNVTVKGSSRSGGAFNYYGLLKGDNYTTYIRTSMGLASFQYADPTASTRSYGDQLQAPEAIRTDLPSGLERTRMVVACILDRSGMLRNVHLLEGATVEMNGKVLAALATWKFQPAMRANQPVEVDAILGFNIDTR